MDEDEDVKEILREYPPMTVEEFKAQLPEIAAAARELFWERMGPEFEPAAMMERLNQKLARSGFSLNQMQKVRVQIVDCCGNVSVEYRFDYVVETSCG